MVAEPLPGAHAKDPNGAEPSLIQDDMQRDLFGPRDVSGKADPAKMTPQRKKKTPEEIDPGHAA
jgi:hypothetical protein